MGLGLQPTEGYHTANSIFEDYPSQLSRLSGKEKKGIKRYAQTLFETSPSDAISYLAGQRGYTNWRPDKLMGELLARPIDYERFRPASTVAFQDFLGRGMSDAEWQQTTEYARSMGVKDPGAFQSLLTSRIASSPEGERKMLSDADRQWQSMYGTMPRDAEGNLIRGMVRYNPNQVKEMIATMIG
jgi:hypothetical protein